MPSENDSAVSSGIENLQQIKNGDDPRVGQTRVEKVQSEVDRLFEVHEMPDRLERDDVSCYVADWKRKIGNAKYDQHVPEREHGQRISGRQNQSGHFALGIAKRAFDSDDTWIDTVAHELAHIVAYVKDEYGGYGNSPGHGTGWKIEAARLGADPTRTDRVSPENQVEANYFIGCPNGCFRNGKQVRSKRVKHPDRYWCPQCESMCVSWEQDDERPSDGGTCAVEW